MPIQNQLPNKNLYITQDEYRELLDSDKKSGKGYKRAYLKNPPKSSQINAALILCVLYEKNDILLRMVERGLKIDEITFSLEKKEQPFSFFALSKGSEKLFESLMPHIDIHKTTNDSYPTLLHIAARYGKTKILSELLKNGANPNIQVAPDFKTTLSAAFEFDSYYRHTTASIIRTDADNQASIHIIKQNTALLLDYCEPDLLYKFSNNKGNFLINCVVEKLWGALELIFEKAIKDNTFEKMQKLFQDFKKIKRFQHYPEQQEKIKEILNIYSEKHLLNQSTGKQSSLVSVIGKTNKSYKI